MSCHCKELCNIVGKQHLKLLIQKEREVNPNLIQRGGGEAAKKSPEGGRKKDGEKNAHKVHPKRMGLEPMTHSVV